MSKREAKKTARALISSVATSVIKKDIKTEDDEPRNHPFVTKRNFISHYFQPHSTHDATVKMEDFTEGSLACHWINPDDSKQCNRAFESPDDLIKHLLTDHSKWSVRGYVCFWKNCSLSHINTTEDLKEHFKIHVVINPGDGNLSDTGANSDSDYVHDEDDNKSSDSDFADSSDEEFSITSKRKGKGKNKKRRRSKAMQPQVSVKRICVEKEDKPKEKTPVVQEYSTSTSTPVVSSGTIQLSFYRFTCQWVVPFKLQGEEKTVMCMRKFTVLEESIDHLSGHHLQKLKMQKRPLMCYWKDCAANKTVFESLNKLMEHVKTHCEEKMIHFNGAGNGGEAKKEESSKSSPTVITPTPESVKARESRNASPRSTASPISKPPVPSEVHSTQTPPTNVENSWMACVLRALVSARIKDVSLVLCPIPKLCHYCRFISLKHRVMCTKDATSLSPYEFTLFNTLYRKDEEKDVSNFKFLSRLYRAIIKDEAQNHNAATFKDLFWFRCLGRNFSECSEHPLKNKTLINLFPLRYKNCAVCSISLDKWPSESQDNIVIELGRGNENSLNVQHDDILMVRGKVYNLTAVVGEAPESSEGNRSFHTCLKVKSMWIYYHNNHSRMINATQVFDKKSARVVIYTAKKDSSDLSKSPPNPKSYIHYYKYETCKEAVDKSLDVSLETPDETEPMATDDTPIQVPLISDSNPVRRISKTEEEIAAVFRNRRLLNRKNVSCINSVLQALLQTGLVTVDKHLCTNKIKCYFCKMLYFLYDVISNKDQKLMNAHHFTSFKAEFDIGETEGDPGVYISDLVNEMVSDERLNHNTNEVKYKFMIRLQKKTCSCMMSCETYHWPVAPTKKHGNLLDLMAKCKTLCTQCNVMSAVHPIQMPDNLIVTIEKDYENPSVSVHYPEEWMSHNTRYYLAAVIVCDYSDPKDKHYLAYCKVFGKWMSYNDEMVSPVLASRVLGNEDACVLVYVNKELTVNTLPSLQDYPDDMLPSVVKMEPKD